MQRTVIDHLCRQFIDMLSYEHAALNIGRWIQVSKEAWCLVSSSKNQRQHIILGFINVFLVCFFFLFLFFFRCYDVFIKIVFLILSHPSEHVTCCCMHSHQRHTEATVLKDCMPFLWPISVFFISTWHGGGDNTNKNYKLNDGAEKVLYILLVVNKSHEATLLPRSILNVSAKPQNRLLYIQVVGQSC